MIKILHANYFYWPATVTTIIACCVARFGSRNYIQQPGKTERDQILGPTATLTER